MAERRPAPTDPAALACHALPVHRSKRLPLIALAALAMVATACGTVAGRAGQDASHSGGRRQVQPVTPTDATRSDVSCSGSELGDDDQTEFLVAHFVVDGRLGARCKGKEEDPTLLEAWAELVAITPPKQLQELAVFAGFIDPRSDVSDDEDITSAFTDDITGDGTTYEMAVNLDDIDDTGDAFILVMAHELSHVFTTDADQLDRRASAVERCTTYVSPADDGCFRTGSWMARWIDRFWSDGQLDTLDPDVDPSTGSGERLCKLDPSFLGPYAASDPEEDFAETFSAFVFEVKVRQPEVQAKLDWMARQPDLVAFRDRAEAAGLTPQPNDFDRCG